MKKIDWVLENKQEEIRELITLIQCPSDFGSNNIKENCDIKNCLKCWNEEIEDMEELK